MLQSLFNIPMFMSSSHSNITHYVPSESYDFTLAKDNHVECSLAQCTFVNSSHLEKFFKRYVFKVFIVEAINHMYNKLEYTLRQFGIFIRFHNSKNEIYDIQTAQSCILIGSQYCSLMLPKITANVFLSL